MGHLSERYRWLAYERDARSGGMIWPDDQASRTAYDWSNEFCFALSIHGEPEWVRHPYDRAFELRRLFAEFLGTFLPVLVAAGGPVVNAVHHGEVPLDAQVLLPGLMMMVVTKWSRVISDPGSSMR